VLRPEISCPNAGSEIRFGSRFGPPPRARVRDGGVREHPGWISCVITRAFGDGLLMTSGAVPNGVTTRACGDEKTGQNNLWPFTVTMRASGDERLRKMECRRKTVTTRAYGDESSPEPGGVAAPVTTRTCGDGRETVDQITGLGPSHAQRRIFTSY